MRCCRALARRCAASASPATRSSAGSTGCRPATSGGCATCSRASSRRTSLRPSRPPAGRRCAASRVAGDDSPLLGQVRERALDLFGYRDDAHIEAWRPHADPATEGARWNAFTHVWSGEARSAAAIARAAAFRGYGAAFYEQALAALEARGWLASDGATYRTTEAGQALRDAVERQTDDWFYAAWSVLDEAELAELRGLVARLLEALRRVP